MNDQIAMLQTEKQATLEAIAKARSEHAKLLNEHQRLVATTENKDETIARLDAQIDSLFDEMEEYEQEIALKNQ